MNEETKKIKERVLEKFKMIKVKRFLGETEKSPAAIARKRLPTVFSQKEFIKGIEVAIDETLKELKKKDIVRNPLEQEEDVIGARK